MEIIPAILPREWSDIEEKTLLVHKLADTVQIDICDGKFVGSTSWPYRKPDKNFEDLIHEDRGMPEWEDIDYEFDLMVQEPTVDDMRKWMSAGAKRIVLHAESSSDLTPLMAVLDGLVEIGLALNIKTPLDIIKKYKDKISYIQFMGITKVGFQGQAFDPRVLEKIKEVKEKYPDFPVQVDGGVSLATAQELKAAGVDRIVVGSTLFGTHNSMTPYESVVDTFHQLKRI